MSEGGKRLDFARKEKLPKDTLIFQVEDGTIFYRNYKYPERLYVKWQSNEIEAKLPGKVLFNLHAFDNVLYFQPDEPGLEQKIYKAEFTPSGGIDVSCVRETLEGERGEAGGLMSRLIDGKRYIYRMCDDPETDLILVEASFIGLVQCAVHRGKTINLLETSSSSSLTAKNLGENAILIEGPGSSHLKCFAPPDSSKFLYFAFAKSFYVLDTETLQFLPALEINNIDSITDITGICNGVLTVTGTDAKLKYVMTARLPRGYFEH